MEVVAIPVGSGRVLIGSPLLLPVGGAARSHGLSAVRLVLGDAAAVAQLRAKWSRLGLGGQGRQQPAAALRDSLDRAVTTGRLNAVHVPPADRIRLDIAWYEGRAGTTAPAAAGHGPDVARWSDKQKILYAIEHAIPKLRAKGQEEVANALKAMIEPESVAFTLGLFAAWAAAHAYGVGEIADAALIALALATAGIKGVRAIIDMALATYDATQARNVAELDKVADRIAADLIILGEAFLTALLARIAARRAARARAGSAGGSRPAGGQTQARTGTASGQTAGKPTSYARPSGYRKGVRDQVWENAKGEDGLVRDPLTGKVMTQDEAWDMGHKPGYEFRTHAQSAAERGITRQQFLDEHNDPSHYRPELPSSNRSHAGENTTGDWFGPH